MSNKSILIGLADAIVAELNSYGWTTEIWQKPANPGDAPTFAVPGFVARRIYNTDAPMETNEGLRVDVVLGDIDRQASSRDSRQGDYRIDFAFRQVIDPDDPDQTEPDAANVDPLGMLVEEADDHFFQLKRLVISAQNITLGAGWIKSQVVYPYLPTQLRTESRFVSLLRLTYRVIK
jgi:hypothetical protein